MFSNLNSLHKNTVLRNRVSSIIQKYVFPLNVPDKKENIINAMYPGYWVLSDHRKN